MKPGKKIIKLAKEYGFDNAEYLYSKGEYHIFIPCFTNPTEEEPMIGLPIYLIQHGDTAYDWQGVGQPPLLNLPPE